MAELEIHHEEHDHAKDPLGQKVGIQAAILAVLLAIVSISSHRSHTEVIIRKSDANDQWTYYQSTRLKFHNLELADRLTNLVATGEAREKALADIEKEKKKYDERGKEIQEKAKTAEEATEAAEHRALRYDIGEGLLEIALVLSSLYFISRKNLFPVIGVIAGIAGLAFAISGLAV